MEFAVEKYYETIKGFYAVMQKHEEIADSRLSDDTWTLKEMVGHLIDSASNNHQRFIRLQQERRIEFPSYDAEEWRKVSGVGEYKYRSLIELWKMYNEYIVYIIRSIKKESLENYWETKEGKLSLKYLVEDYFVHLHWHIDLFERRVNELEERG